VTDTEQGKKGALIGLLFGQEGRSLENVKFFRGDRAVISEEEFCDQVHSGLLQRKMGRAKVSDGFCENSHSLNVEAFVSTL
jgi:hypothetical protein